MALSAEQRAALARDLERIMEVQDDLVESSVVSLSRAYGDAATSALTRIRRLARGLKTDAAGRLIPDLTVATSISPTLLRDNEPWRLVWEEWIGRLSQIVKLQEDYARRIGRANALWTGVERNALRALAGLWPADGVPVEGMAGRFYALTVSERTKLANHITRHILGRLPEATLEDVISQDLNRSASAARQLIRDETMSFARTAHQLKAESLGLEWFRYSGPDDQAARPFCSARVGRAFERRAIDAMDNGQTGPGTALTACGGFNCRHRWAAVDPEWYDEAEWSAMTRGAAAPEE